MCEWRQELGDLVLVNDGNVPTATAGMPVLRLVDADGFCLLGPGAVPELPEPGKSWDFAGVVYEMSDEPQVRRVETVDDGAGKYQMEVVTMQSKLKPAAKPKQAARVNPELVDLRNLSVRHSALTQSVACSCGKPLAFGWLVWEGMQPLCAECGRQYRLPAGWVEQVNAACPEPTELQRNFAILPARQVQNTVCGACRGPRPDTWTQVIQRGEFGHEAGAADRYHGREHLFCPDCLAARPEWNFICDVVDAYHAASGTGPRPLRPKPEAPKPPTAEELAERAKAERLAEAAKAVALILWPGPPGDRYEGERREHEARVTRRGLALLRAVETYLDEKDKQ